MNFKEARAAIGLTQVQVSENLGISVHTLQHWEQGSRSCPLWLEPMLVNAVLDLKRPKLYTVKFVTDEKENTVIVEALSAYQALKSCDINIESVTNISAEYIPVSDAK